jgi:hypothetical protein
MSTPACYQAALQTHFKSLPNAEAVFQLLEDQPHSVDAVVIFPQALDALKAQQTQAAHSAPPSRADDSQTLAAGGAQGAAERPLAATQGGAGHPGHVEADEPAGDGLLLHYIIRMNGSDVPPTQLLQDLFDVSPGLMPLPGNLLWWVALKAAVQTTGLAGSLDTIHAA